MKRDKIYISTQARKSDVISLLNFAIEQKVGLELSSGFDTSINNLFEIISNENLNYKFHNYFPIPNEPFVLNLGSLNNEVRRKSIDFVKRNLLLSKKLNLEYYSCHAGFLIDPNPNDLGSQFDLSLITKSLYDESLISFKKSIIELIKFSEINNIKLLIENNVVPSINIYNGIPVALLTNVKEMILFFEEFKNSIGLLFDTAHYKVNCLSMNLELSDAKLLSKYCKVVHHSEPIKENDINLPFKKDYWFMDYINLFNHCDHVLEFKNVSNNELKSAINAISK